ncbi:MAG: formylmethanofuran dehydrogenase subunit C [Hyphomicrobiaceae bacterium]|nr:formylmethanofuran dehydrogenase subunit C [Hyphomicrobiaceae bacterium]
MSGFTLTLQSAPPERLDLSGLTPQALADRSAGQIAHMVVGTSKAPVTVGDVFKIAGATGETLRIEGSSDRLDFVGAKLTHGVIIVDGDVGAYAAADMKGGRLEIGGSAGPGLGAAMKGGVVLVKGNAGELVGGVRTGAQYGMQGGTIVVEGNIGERAGDRMRRGTIIARGTFGRWAGTRMMGGTLWAVGGFGEEPGLQMRRGTLIAPTVARMLPTFGDGGMHDLTILRILSRDLARQLGSLAPPPLPAKVHKYSGDLAIFGKGELLLTA